MRKPKIKNIKLICCIVTIVLVVACTYLSFSPFSRGAYADDFDETYAQHFRPLNDLDFILVNFSYDDELITWLKKDELLGAAVEIVKSQFPEQLQHKVILVDESEAYTGLKLHLDFQLFSAPFNNYPHVNKPYISSALMALFSYEVYEDGNVSVVERKIHSKPYIVKSTNLLTSRMVKRDMKRAVENYLTRLDSCLSGKTYEQCTINDLGYFDVNQMRGMEFP